VESLRLGAALHKSHPSHGSHPSHRLYRSRIGERCVLHLEGAASAPESAHQQWGGSPHRTEHWLSVVEGNCVARESEVESNRRRTAGP
jgi:hypothetical protein